MSSLAPTPARERSWWITPLSMLTVAAISFLLYSRALDFGFFNDDPTGHFAWMESRGYIDFFRSSADYGYYRPVVFVLLRALVDTAGYNAAPFHALLLGLHAANVALLWLLIRRLSGSDVYAWATSLIFAFSPFSYEAVAYVASLTHPLLLFWLLLTMLLYQQARRLYGAGEKNRRFLCYGAAMITLLLGLLTHENGLFIPLALVGIEWVERPPHSLTDALRRPFLPYLLVTPIFLFLWWSIPKSGEQTLPSLAEWFSNLVPFLQTLVYPLLPLLRLTADDIPALLILAVLTLAITFLAAWLARARGLWLFGLSWFVFSSLPAVLFLSPAYLYGSPRLHYLPSAGVAMLWGMPLLTLARRMPDETWKQLAAGAAGIAYILAILFPPMDFIRCELDFYDETSRIVRQMGARGEESADRSLLFVNVPQFFSSYSEHPEGCPNPYPWTPVGAVIMPAYASARDFVRFNEGSDQAAAAVTIDAYAPGWNTYGSTLSPAELREQMHEAAVYIYDLNTGDFFDLSAAWLPDGAAETDPLALFGDFIQLNTAVVARAGADEVSISLTWQKHGEEADGVTPVVFVHIYDASGQLVAQHDGPPGSNYVPFAWWQTEDAIIDRHRIELPADLEPGSYTVVAGLYDPLTGERFSSRTDGVPLADNALVLGHVTLP